MRSIIACVAAFVFVYMQTEIHAFSSPQNCIEETMQLVKKRRIELTTNYLLSNEQVGESLRQMCQYYVPHKVHEVIKLVQRENCAQKIPTDSEFEESIFEAYVDLLDRLKTYEGQEIPNSFGRHNDYITGRTNAFFDITSGRLAGICLHKNVDEIE